LCSMHARRLEGQTQLQREGCARPLPLRSPGEMLDFPTGGGEKGETHDTDRRSRGTAADRGQRETELEDVGKMVTYDRGRSKCPKAENPNGA